jgi:hypothetical protein
MICATPSADCAPDCTVSRFKGGGYSAVTDLLLAVENS